MAQKYFIEYFYTPSGTTVVEKRLADIAKGAIHCIYDRPSLEAFADYLRKQQDLYISQNKRCRPVEIKLRLSDGDSLGPGTGMSIGKISVMISDAEREILAEEVKTDMIPEAAICPDELFAASKNLLDEVRKYTMGAGYRTQLLNAAARLKKVLRE